MRSNFSSSFFLITVVYVLPLCLHCMWCFLLLCRFYSSEENVWKLCEQVKKQNPNELSKCYAVFVSNERRTVPLWRQKAGRGEDKLVVWVSHNFFFIFYFRCTTKPKNVFHFLRNFEPLKLRDIPIRTFLNAQNCYESKHSFVSLWKWLIYIQSGYIANASSHISIFFWSWVVCITSLFHLSWFALNIFWLVD